MALNATIKYSIQGFYSVLLIYTPFEVNNDELNCKLSSLSSWYWRLNGPFLYQDFFLKRIRLFHWTMFVLHTLSPTYQSQAPLGFNIGSPWPAAGCCCSKFLTHIVSISKVNYIIGVLFNVSLWKKNTFLNMYSFQLKKIREFLMA